ncbi:MAG: DUF2206 domain-containing protein [Candidatus Bathyarchaeota archaeon]
MKNRIFVILILTILMNIVVALDIPILRQMICIFYFLFTPGYLLLTIFSLEKLDSIDKLVLSIGLSIFLLMFIGFLINALYPVFGVLTPLSTLPLTLTLSSITIILAIISYYTNNHFSSLNIPEINFLPKIIFLISIPVLSAFATWFNNTLILLLVIVLIVLLTLATIFFKNFIPTELYPVLIVSIGISLLFHMSLISQYLTGWDLFPEYYVFKITKSNLLWNPHFDFNNLQLASYNTMLSITVLPTMLSSFFNMSEEMIFKIIYILIFSIVPLTLYQTWKHLIGKSAAILSAFYFMFSSHFFATTEMRQPIAELFVSLIIFLIVVKKIDIRKRNVLLLTFGAALVVSHYSRLYLMLFAIIFAWIFLIITNKTKIKFRSITTSLVLLFFTMAFAWYTYVSISPTNLLSQFINDTLNSLSTEFLQFGNRGADLASFVNPLSAPSLLHLIDNVFSKILYLFIFVGFIALFSYRSKYTEMKFDWEYSLMIMANFFILGIVILVPSVGPSFVEGRFFHATLFFLAPLTIVGGKTFFKWIEKFYSVISNKNILKPSNRAISFVCIVLVIIFLFKIGFIYEISGDSVPTSVSLSKDRMRTSTDIGLKATFYDFYVPRQDVFSAEWLSSNIEDQSTIYADYISRLKVLIGYGMIDLNTVRYLDNSTLIETDGYIYLRSQNVIDGILRYLNYNTEILNSLDITEVSDLIGDANKIYSNGFSDIYQSFNSS